MDDLILNLLKKNGRVIIPDFGALIVKQKAPLTVIFNEFLQYNDGALVGAVSAKQNIEREEATKNIKAFTAEIEKKLNNKENVEIKGVGVLSKSSTGKITLSPLSEKPKEEKAPELQGVETDDKSDEGIKAEKKEEQEKKKPEIVADKIIPKEEEKVIPQQEKEIKQEAPKVEKPTEEYHPITEYYGDNANNSTLNIVLWIIIIIVVNGAIVGYFFFSDEIKALFGKGDKTVTKKEVPVKTVEEAIADSLIKGLEITEPEIATQDEAESGSIDNEIYVGTKYYVVAGVFRIESNADNLVNRLKNKGYNSEKFGKIGQMYAVSYDVFPTRAEADRYMIKIRNEIDTEAWIKIVN